MSDTNPTLIKYNKEIISSMILLGHSPDDVTDKLIEIGINSEEVDIYHRSAIEIPPFMESINVFLHLIYILLGCSALILAPKEKKWLGIIFLPFALPTLKRFKLHCKYTINSMKHKRYLNKRLKRS